MVNDHIAFYDGQNKGLEVHAKKITGEKAAGGAISSFRSATFTGIDGGKVYTQGKLAPAATFSANHGSYELQNVSDVPAEIKSQYNVDWELTLADTVIVPSLDLDQWP